MSSKVSIKKIREIFEGKCFIPEDGFKTFSVLLPIVEREGKLYLMYELRAKDMKRQPGEVCFPGGELEVNETPKEAALRETCEEIGIREEQIQVLSKLNTIYTYSNMILHCYIGIISKDALQNLCLNTAEVEEVFYIGIDDLLTTEPELYKTEVIQNVPEGFPYDKVNGGKPYKWRKGFADVPIYEVDNRIVWGLTARITKRFLSIIREGK